MKPLTQTEHNIRILHITDDRIVDPAGALESLSEKEYQLSRNMIVRVCRRHGTTGPSGECHFELNSTGREIPVWEVVEGEDFQFYVIDDQINYERYLYVEVGESTWISRQFILDLVQEMGQLPFWGVVFTLPNTGTMVIFFNFIFLYGAGYERCVDLDTLLAAISPPHGTGCSGEGGGAH